MRQKEIVDHQVPAPRCTIKCEGQQERQRDSERDGQPVWQRAHQPQDSNWGQAYNGSERVANRKRAEEEAVVALEDQATGAALGIHAQWPREKKRSATVWATVP